MGKSKTRILKKGINNIFPYMTREDALNSVVKNINHKKEVIDTITLFGLTAEEILEAGAEYEDVMAFGGILK